MGFQGTYKNQYGEYDNAYPFNLTVETKSPINLNDEILLNKASFAKNDQLNVTGVKSAPETTQYKLHLYDAKNNQWLTNLTEYGKTIDYDLSDIPAGTYVLNIWAKDEASSSKYDGWKLKVININSNVNKVLSVENIQSTVKRYGIYRMPKTVVATAEDGSKTSKPVIWDSEANTKKAGVFEIYGMVLGSDTKVKLTLTVEETFGNTNGNIINFGYVAKDGDYIYYSESGDSDKLYRAKSVGEELTKISDDSAIFINVFKGYIYYTNLSDNNSLYRIKLDGTDRKKLTSKGFINTIVQDDWIYCTDDEELNIYKISLDGSIIKKLNSEASLNLNITDDRIYYNNLDDSLKIYRISKDGTGKTKVLNDTAGYINVVEDTIYYLNLDDQAKIYKVKTDGTGKTKVYNIPSGYLNLADNGRLYFLDFSVNHTAYIDTLDNEKLNPLQNSGHFLNVIDEYVYHIGLEVLGMFRTHNEGPQSFPFGKYYKTVDDVTLNIIEGTTPYLPLYVDAITINDEKSTASVIWDTENVDTSIEGKHIYKGSIVGCDLKVKATVNLLTIVKLSDTSFNLLVLVNEKSYFPNTTMATLSNGEVRQVYIKWEKNFIEESEVGEYSFDGTIAGYAEIIKIKVTVEEVETVDFQDKNSEILRYGKVELPRTTVATTTSGRKITSPIVWKYTGNITGVNMVGTDYYKTVNTDFIGTHNFQGTVLGYSSKLNYTINVFENTGLPTGDIIGRYDGYTLFYVDNKIYTINPASTEKKLIADDRNILGNKPLAPIMFYNGYVYYRGIGNGAANQEGIYRIKLDGSGKQLIRNVHIYDFKIANDLIYYSNYTTLYIAKLEDSTVLSRLNLSYPYRVEIKDDFIYYSGTIGFSDVTMRAKKDGSNPTVFFIGKLGDIVGDYIYYYQGGTLQRMKLDGSSKLVYSDITSYNNIIIKDDYMYYATYDGIYKKNTNGTGNTLLLLKTGGYGFTHFSLFEGFIYYDGGYPYEWIWRVKTDGTINEIVGKYY